MVAAHIFARIQRDLTNANVPQDSSLKRIIKRAKVSQYIFSGLNCEFIYIDLSLFT
jgi:hypothetical protein